MFPFKFFFECAGDHNFLSYMALAVLCQADGGMEINSYKRFRTGRHVLKTSHVEDKGVQDQD